VRRGREVGWDAVNSRHGFPRATYRIHWPGGRVETTRNRERAQRATADGATVTAITRTGP
jgi:hypothetical protein